MTKLPPVMPVKTPIVKPEPVRAVKPTTGAGIPPSFDSLFAVPVNPLASVEFPSDTEGSAALELEVAESFIREQRQDEREQWRLLTDPDFWCCIVFQSRAQRDEFLQGAGLPDLGPKYLNGLTVAQRLGVKVTPIVLPRKVARPMPKTLRAAKAIPAKEVKDHA